MNLYINRTIRHTLHAHQLPVFSAPAFGRLNGHYLSHLRWGLKFEWKPLKPTCQVWNLDESHSNARQITFKSWRAPALDGLKSKCHSGHILVPLKKVLNLNLRLSSSEKDCKEARIQIKTPEGPVGLNQQTGSLIFELKLFLDLDSRLIRLESVVRGAWGPSQGELGVTVEESEIGSVESMHISWHLYLHWGRGQ